MLICLFFCWHLSSYYFLFFLIRLSQRGYRLANLSIGMVKCIAVIHRYWDGWCASFLHFSKIFSFKSPQIDEFKFHSLQFEKKNTKVQLLPIILCDFSRLTFGKYIKFWQIVKERIGRNYALDENNDYFKQTNLQKLPIESVTDKSFSKKFRFCTANVQWQIFCCMGE